MSTRFSAMAEYSSTRPESSDPSVLVGINLRAMKAAAVNRWLSDPSRRICQYEVPGGGECRDPNCEDIHPSMEWTVEPSGTPSFLPYVVTHIFIPSPASFPILPFFCSPSSVARIDHETAQHLHAALPKSSQVTREQLEAALQEAREPDIGYHMRVRDALEKLGLRTAP